MHADERSTAATPEQQAALEQVINPSVELLRADRVTPEPIEWLWDGYIAGGKLHIIAGAPGTGKTTVALAIAATVTIGGVWPDGTAAPVGDVLLWSGEDSPADILIPRLMAAGANRERVHLVRTVGVGVDRRPFDPAIDMGALRLRAAQLGQVALLVIDPIVSAVRGDSHNNAETRRALQPIVDFAESLRVATIGISHFSKGTQGRDTVERVAGSLAFGALPRIVLATAKMPDEQGGGHALIRAKSNIGPDGGGFRYRLRQDPLAAAHGHIVASRSEWMGEIVGSAREILAQAETPPDAEERSALSDAMEFLLGELRDGPRTATDVQAAAEKAGHAARTMRRARERLGLRKRKRPGIGGEWEWALAAHDQELGQLGHVAKAEEGGQLTHSNGQVARTHNAEGGHDPLPWPDGRVGQVGQLESTDRDAEEI